jgi:hypothetical protein
VSDPLLHVNAVTELGHLQHLCLRRRNQLFIPEAKKVKSKKNKRTIKLDRGWEVI